MQLGQVLTRAQLDARVTRDTYWRTIAERFNDHSLQPLFDFTASVDEADSSLPPVCHRTPEILKSYFRDTRSRFTIYLNNWKQSGQMDPENIRVFLPKCKKNDTKVSVLGKRMWIIFVVTRMGTPFVDNLLLESFSRLISNESSAYEEGVNDQFGVGSTDWREKSCLNRKMLSSRQSQSSFGQLLEEYRGLVEDLRTEMRNTGAKSDGVSEISPVNKRKTEGYLHDEKESYEYENLLVLKNKQLQDTINENADSRIIKILEAGLDR